VAFRVPPQQPEGKATWAAPMITEGEPAMHSPLRRAAKALAGLVVAAGFALAAAPPGGAASIGEGATEKQILSEKLPNVPGKTLTVIEVDYRPGGFSAPHRHPASGFVFAYVLSGTVRSQIEGEPLRVYRAGQSWTEPPNSHHLVSANARDCRLTSTIATDSEHTDQCVEHDPVAPRLSCHRERRCKGSVCLGPGQRLRGRRRFPEGV
jgi:quercetin dioxygenase-like cupin family protein